MDEPMTPPTKECPICHAKTMQVDCASTWENITRSSNRYDYSSCRSCSVISLLPVPSTVDLSDHYAHIDAKASGQASQQPEAISTPRPEKSSWLGRYWRFVNDPYPYLSSGRAHAVSSPIVDLGAGSGLFCLMAEAKGYSVSGVEQSEDSVSEAVSMGTKVRQGDVLHPASLPEINAAKTVTMNHVLEHLIRPKEFLQELHDAMAPGTTLILMIPNPSCLWRRLFGSGWHGWDPPIHVHHYPATALRRVLRQSGFHNVKIVTKARPDGLTRSLIHSGRLPQARYLWLRLLLLPLLPVMEAFGLGDELICTATKR